jgi:hypothetical protein
VDRVLCGVPADARPWDVIVAARAGQPRRAIGAVDWLVELPGADDAAQLARAAEALFAAAMLDGSRLFFEPLVDLDRTMDVMHGLLDRCCNPRPAYQAVRCLNTVLFAAPETRNPGACPTVPGGRAIEARGVNHTDWLLLPDAGLPAPAGLLPAAGAATAYRLRSGTSQELEAGPRDPIVEPTLLRVPADARVSWPR